MPRAAGRHFLQIPGPTNVPDRVLRAIDFPTMDHRSPDFGVLGKEVLAGMKRVFRTSSHVVIYPASAPAPGRPRSSTRSRPATRS
jgi:alanine-glyoxylate transaminase/serine-glyoxylate transaminase/serine-pyruvate transaminase